MKKLIIKKQGLEVQHCKFDDEQVMQDFIKLLADQAPWGKPDRWLPDSPMSPLSDEEKAKAQESRKVIVKEAKPESIVQVQKELEDGSIVTEDVVMPAVEEESYMEYFFPAEYTIEITDITVEIEQEKANAEALAYLAETDWLMIRELEIGKPMPEEIKIKRQEARDKVVK